MKKLSTTDKVRRKRTPKIDDNIDGQKVKRRKSDMNMKQPEPSASNLLSTSTEKKLSTDTNKVETKQTQNHFIYYYFYFKECFKLSRNWFFTCFISTKWFMFEF